MGLIIRAGVGFSREKLDQNSRVRAQIFEPNAQVFEKNERKRSKIFEKLGEIRKNWVCSPFGRDKLGLFWPHLQSRTFS